VAIPTGVNDIKTYDIGNLHVCVEGITAATVGYLEVDYVVDLYTAQIQDPIGGSVVYASDSTHMFKTITTTDAQAVIPFTTNGGNTITSLQTWEGLINVGMTGGTLTNVTCAASGTPGSTVGNVALPFGPIANTAGTFMFAMFAVRALPGSVFTFTPTCASLSAVNLQIATCAYSSLNYSASDSVATPTNATSTTSSSVSFPLTQSAITMLNEYKRRNATSPVNTH